MFYTKEYDYDRKIYNNRICVKGLTLNYLKLATMISYKWLLNWNIVASKIESFYSNVIGMKPLIEKS